MKQKRRKRNVVQRLLACILVAAMLVPLPGMAGSGFGTEVYAAEAQDNIDLPGSGTEADPYLIATADDLWKVTNAAKETELKSCYKLTNDITLSGEWTPIGSEDYPFAGTFDGDNHVVSGITITTKNFVYNGFLVIVQAG